ncbi:MAG TPA: transglutaminase-like domain-containing protein [bacterium]|nr:transglutaminase-like domain-containing protein [bacterium]HOL46785.1 transglutaminase-like domain-containing protein [bacterium]HPQ17740.1 transglutaminase-like domain-containing protein [bacterium]
MKCFLTLFLFCLFFNFSYSNTYLINSLQKIPSFKIYCSVDFNQPLNETQINKLKESKIKIYNQKIKELQNKKNGIIKILSSDFYKLKNLDFIKKINLITHYTEKGFYELHLIIKEENEKNLENEIEFEVALPRDSQWKKIISLNYKINKNAEKEKVRIDETNNRWLIVNFNNFKKDDILTFYSDFIYEVDLNKLVKTNSYTISENINISSEEKKDMQNFLIEGNKIIFSEEKINKIIKEIKTNTYKELNKNIKKYIRKNIKYDYEKRKKFFSGEMIYIDLLDMHQNTIETVKRKIGACPDTCELETALFRGCRVAARPAGRVGHFFSQFFIPTIGWINTSVITDEIFLYEAYNNDDCSFAKWNKKIKIQIKKWNGSVQFEKIIKAE